MRQNDFNFEQVGFQLYENPLLRSFVGFFKWKSAVSCLLKLTFYLIIQCILMPVLPSGSSFYTVLLESLLPLCTQYTSSYSKIYRTETSLIICSHSFFTHLSLSLSQAKQANYSCPPDLPEPLYTYRFCGIAVYGSAQIPLRWLWMVSCGQPRF